MATRARWEPSRPTSVTSRPHPAWPGSSRRYWPCNTAKSPRTCTSHNGIRPSTRHRRGFSFRSTTLLGRQIRVHDGRRFPPSAWAGRMRMQSSSRVRNCRQPTGAAPTMRSRRWWWRVRRRRGWLRRPGCWPIGWRARAPRWRWPNWWWRVRRRRGWLRRPGCWPIGWRARAPRWRWPMWPTRSTITVPGRPGSAPWSPGNAPKRWPDYARWPPTNTPPAWSTQPTPRPSRAPCSSTPAADRSGPEWAANCWWPTNPPSPQPSPNWNRYSWPKPGSPCTTSWPTEQN
ncbi:hypothetical protein MSS4_01867 [Mycobacterium marinum]|nr:hypothetical protein MSS4_01867 [Mycobacterium marinum]